MATSLHIPIGEYLATTYRPDREYVDGELVERHVGKWEHAQVQLLLGMIFGNRRFDWNIRGGSEMRVRVSPTRVRIPDLAFVRPGPRPAVLVDPPLLVIEILSPDDSYAEMTERCRDYQRMGVPTIWILDPIHRTGHQCVDHCWTERAVLEVPGTLIQVTLHELWEMLEETIP